MRRLTCPRLRTFAATGLNWGGGQSSATRKSAKPATPRSQAERSLIYGQSKTPAGWRKVASKSSELNAYFKSETSDWNFTLKNGKRRSALSSLPEDERFGLANWAKSVLTQSVAYVPTATGLWGGANFLERECYDMFGIRFAGNPNLERILTPDGWLGHPLRKDFPVKSDQFPNVES